MNRKFFLATIILIAFSSNIFAHKVFYKKGNNTIFNVKIISGNDLENSRFCKVKVNDTTKTFTPSDISEYQLADGRHYFSLPLPKSNPSKNYFFELILDGSCKLYKLKDYNETTYYLQKGTDSLYCISSRVIFGERSFNQTELHAYLDENPRISEIVYQTEYTKSSLKKLIYRYNSYTPRWTTSTYGLMASLISSQLEKSDKSSALDKTGISKITGNGYKVGVFYNFPLKYEGWLLRGSLAYYQTNFSEKKQNETYFQSISLTSSAFDIPITITYMYNNLLRVKPYLFAGVDALYNFHKKSTLYEYQHINSKDLVVNKTTGINLTSNFQPGIQIGIGSNFMVNSNRYIFFEISYNPRINMNSIFRSTDLTFTTGINL